MLPLSTLRTLQSCLLIVLLLSEATLQCGPGRRSGGRRTRAGKKTPLVYKQHVPNVSENNIGASGLPEGAITRNDPRFKDLVENNNPNIVIRDEEGDGSDKIMSKRCYDSLKVLAVLVQNQWPEVANDQAPIRLKVKEAWDDNHMHGENSLHYEGRAVDVALSDRDRSKLGMLARLAVEAGFDWVYYEAQGHIHCSVKSESSAASKRGGCFDSSGIVQSETRGHITMSELQIGERVLSMRSDGILEFNEVMTFMDRDESELAQFYTLTTESGEALTLTPKHLLFVMRNSSTDVRSLDWDIVYADTVAVGNYLITGESDSTLSASQVVHVEVVMRQGVYAPLTKHGTIVVDGVVASCYAYINSVQVAHSVFAPMRVLHDVSQYIPSFVWTSSVVVGNTSNVSNGMHWYARLLYAIGTKLLNEDILYVH